MLLIYLPAKKAYSAKNANNPVYIANIILLSLYKVKYFL